MWNICDSFNFINFLYRENQTDECPPFVKNASLYGSGAINNNNNNQVRMLKW